MFLVDFLLFVLEVISQKITQIFGKKMHETEIERACVINVCVPFLAMIPRTDDGLCLNQNKLYASSNLTMLRAKIHCMATP